MMVTVIMVLVLGVPIAVLVGALAVWLGSRIAASLTGAVQDPAEPKPEMTQPYIPDRGDQTNPLDQVQPGWIGRPDD